MTEQIESVLKYSFKNKELLTLSLAHKSYANENSGKHNEKLEFLGDAVIDLIVSEYLMEYFPDLEEGPLSKLRASLVNEAGLSQVALKLNLQEYILLGKGEVQSGGANKPRLLASCFEALAGALFIDAGFEQTKIVIREIFSDKVKDLDTSTPLEFDYKSKLQEIIQAEKKITPTYEVRATNGPAHDRSFEVVVRVGDADIALGTGKSKKIAEQCAAQKALEVINGGTQ